MIAKLTLIIMSLCPKTGTVQTKMNCNLYYVNCIIGYNGQWSMKDVKRCKEKYSSRKLPSNSK
jgi:hypothetical protein